MAFHPISTDQELTQKLYATTDASVWAEECADVIWNLPAEHTKGDITGLLIGWFANAMATAVDRATFPSSAHNMDVVLETMQEEVYSVNVANGWFDEGRTFGDDIALQHSEVSEALEEFRRFKDTATRWEHPDSKAVYSWDDLQTDLQDNSDGPALIVERDGCYFPVSPHGRVSTKAFKPVGVASEAADIQVRLLDFCKRHSIRLGAEFRGKLSYNRTRGHKHGGKAM